MRIGDREEAAELPRQQPRTGKALEVVDGDWTEKVPN